MTRDQKSTQPGHPSMGSHNEYQRMVMLCGWGVKAGMVREWVADKTVISLTQAIPEHNGLTGFISHKVLYKCLIRLTEYFTPSSVMTFQMFVQMK